MKRSPSIRASWMTLGCLITPSLAFQASIHHDEPIRPMPGDRAQSISPSIGSSTYAMDGLDLGSSSASLQGENDQPTRSQDGSSSPLCTLGILSDIQYAPVPDGHSHSGTPRYYRHALTVARTAAHRFQEAQASVVINLGDIVDGKCLRATNPPLVGPDAVDDVLDALSVYTHGPLLHIYGNHCLYNMDRRTIQSKLNVPIFSEADNELVGYYSTLVPGTKIRLVVLDSYDVTLLQRTEGSRKRAQAVQLLRQYNAANYDAGEENSSEGLEGLEKRFVAYNGAVGHVQLDWLDDELTQSRRRGERVIVLSHQPILPGSCNPNCLVWNFDELLEVLRRHADVVLASFAGHAHKGGHKLDERSGIHFRVVEAVLESPHPMETFALLDIYPDRLHMRGFGDCHSAVYALAHPIPMTEAAPRHDISMTSSRA